MNNIRAREAAVLADAYRKHKSRYVGVTQALLAEKMGVQQGTFSAWLNGISRCPDDKLMMLGELLEFEPETARPGVRLRMSPEVTDDQERDSLVNMILRLSDDRRRQALDYVRFLTAQQ